MPLRSDNWKKDFGIIVLWYLANDICDTSATRMKRSSRTKVHFTHVWEFGMDFGLSLRDLI
jgi:hypothetical protein